MRLKGNLYEAWDQIILPIRSIFGIGSKSLPQSLSRRIAVGKRTLILAIVVIIIGAALIVYQDPQFRLALNFSIMSLAASSAATTTSITPAISQGG